MRVKLPFLLLAIGMAANLSAALPSQKVSGNYHWLSGESTATIGSTEIFTNGTQIATEYRPTCTIAAALPDGKKGVAWYVKNSKGGVQISTAFDYLCEFEGDLEWTKDDNYGDRVTLGLECDWISYKICYGTGYSGGSAPGEQNDICYTNKVKLADSLERTGYTFVSWTNAAQAAQSFAAGAAVTGSSFTLANHDDTAVVRLVAKWQPHTYSISYDLAGGQASTSQPTTVTYDKWFLVADPTRVGYDFKEWQISGQSGSAWSTRRNQTNQTTEFLNLTPDQGATVTLTAVWTPATYTVLLNNHGATSGEKSVTVTYDAKYDSVNIPAKSGSNFTGYFTTESEGDDKYWDAEGQPTKGVWDIPSNVTFHARWDVSQIYVEYDANGGEGKIEPQLVNYNEPVTLSDGTGISRVGCNLLGWSESASATTPQYQLGSEQRFTKTTMLYAVWEMYYFVAFKPNGGVGEMAMQQFTFTAVNPLPPNEFTKTGYGFGGWATNEAAAAKLEVEYADRELIVSPLTLVPGNTNELWAVWKTNAYFVAYEAGAGSGAPMPVQAFVYDQTQALSRCTFTAPSDLKTFDCWLSADTGVRYTDGQIVSNLTAVANVTNTLTALWKYDVGKYSEAMHCTTLRWGVHNEGYESWEISQTGGVSGDSCCKQLGALGPSSKEWLFAQLTTNGTLSLSVRWDRSVGTEAGLLIGLSDSEDNFSVGGQVVYEYFDTSKEWKTLSIPLDLAQNALPVYVHLAAFNTDMTSEAVLSIDNVSWTPGSGAEPGPEDAPTVTKVEMKDGNIVIESSGNAKFGYQVWRAASLVAPIDWKLYEGSYQPGQDKGQSFTVPIDPSDAQMFYKVEVLKKK